VDDLINDLARGNVTEVKVVLASIVAALAVYQILLMLVGWWKVKLPFLKEGPATFSHRAVGDVILGITSFVAFMCVGYFGFDDDGAFHAVTGGLLFAALALKIVIIHWWRSMNELLPALGIIVFILFIVTWLSSAGGALAGE
jgi:hypothetical protein